MQHTARTKRQKYYKHRQQKKVTPKKNSEYTTRATHSKNRDKNKISSGNGN
uniref:Uncharacterized protein n=1 Tax=Octopus bimaculoides TaxID=37653 RepID=A0A0L8FGK7_OCTBM